MDSTVMKSTPVPAVSGAGSGKRQRSKVSLWLGRVVKCGVPLCVSVLLVVWLFRKVDIHDVEKVVREGCDYWWIVLMMLITMLSHMIRGIRWGIQLRAAGIPRIPVVVESVSIFGAYALNLVFPNIGEVWRCVYITRRERTSFSTVLGTDIGDRGSDGIVVLMLLGLALIVAHPAIMSFMEHYAVGRDIARFTDNPWLWSLIALAFLTIWVVCHFFRKEKYIDRFDCDLKRIWDGFRVIFRMKGRGLYVVLTLGIWFCYFMETYVCFHAFPFTRRLIEEPGMAWGLIPGLVVFVFGSFSMAIPSNGGLGPWNLAVMFVLSLYGVSDAEGAAYSMLVWGSQAAMLVALGIFSAIYVMLDKRRDVPPVAKTVTATKTAELPETVG